MSLHQNHHRITTIRQRIQKQNEHEIQLNISRAGTSLLSPISSIILEPPSIIPCRRNGSDTVDLSLLNKEYIFISSSIVPLLLVLAYAYAAESLFSVNPVQAL